MIIMRLGSQSYFYLPFIFNEMKFYSLLVLCDDILNEVYDYMQ